MNKYTVLLYEGAGALLMPLEVEADSEEEALNYVADKLEGEIK